MLDLFKKYRLILLPLALVVIFDLSLLVTNFILSAQLEVASVNINIAGRQRMLSQKMNKELALIHFKIDRGLSYDDGKKRLLASITLFNKTLVAFTYGGETISAEGQPVYISKITQRESRRILKDAQTLWAPIHSQFRNALSNNEIDLEKIDNLLIQSEHSNSDLLALMNDLTNQLESDAKNKTYLLRLLQSVVVILVLVSFMIASIRLLRRERYYNTLMENSADIVLGIDVFNGNVTFVSTSVDLLLNHNSHYFLGKHFGRLFSSGSERYLKQLLEQIKQHNGIEVDRCDVELVTEDGSIIQAEMIMKLSKSENGQSLELMADIRDITERKKSEMMLFEMAHKDVLTGLPNRASFYITAEKAIGRAKRTHSSAALLFIDLDGFKNINDQYGHQVGDLLLSQLATKIKYCLRSTDSVFRIGGDEFLVLLERVGERDDIVAIGDKLIQSISTKIEIDEHLCQVGASIGVSIYPEHGRDIIKLTKKADNAMYIVKQTGKNAVGFADDD